MADYGQMFSDYIDRRVNDNLDRVGMGEDKTKANVAPVTQTIKSDSEGNTSIQTTGAPEDVATIHAPAIQPTQNQGPVAGPVAPQPAPQPQPQPAPQAMPPQGPVAPGAPQIPPPGQPPVSGPPPGMPPAPQAMPPQGPVAPGGPQAMPPVGGPPPGMPPAPQAMPPQGPINPATPQPAPAPVQQPPAPTPTAQTLPGVQAQPHIDQLLNAQNNTAALTKLQQDETAPDYIRQAAAKQAHAHLTDYQGQSQAQRDGDRLIAGANNGDQKDSKELAKIMASTSTKEDEGSYLKAYILQRFGLHDLSKQEQIKLGAGSIMNHVTLPDGTNAVVRQRADGIATYGVDSEGNQLTQSQLTAATGAYQKGAVTGQTFGKDANGNVISHTVMPNGQGVRWKNETTGQALSSAPAGYHSMGQKSLEQIEAEKGVGIGAQLETKMRKANADAVALGATPPFSETQIQTAKAQATPSTRAPGATPAGAQGETAEQTAARLGIRISPQGGERDRQGQANQVAQWYAGGMVGPRPAEPGTSAHEGKRAIDVPSDQRTPENRKALEAEGFKNTVPGEPWHFEKPKAAITTPSTPTVSSGNPIADKIANYEMKMPASRSAAYGPMMRDVLRANPDFDETKYATAQATRTDFSKSSQQSAGGQLNAINRIVPHTNEFMKVAQAVYTHDMPIVNEYATKYKFNIGDGDAAAIKAMAPFIATEYQKAIAGGLGGVDERMTNVKNIENLSPKQLVKVIGELQHLSADQGITLKQKWTSSSLPAKQFDDKLVPEARDLVTKREHQRENERTQTRSNW